MATKKVEPAADAALAAAAAPAPATAPAPYEPPVLIIPPAAPVVAADGPVSIGEYLLTRSISDKRVELLAGFQADCAARGVISATTADFEAALSAFVNKPI